MAYKWIVGSSAFAALLLAGFAGAPAGHADDCTADFASLDCMMASENANAFPSAPSADSGPQVFTPAFGGPPEVGLPVAPGADTFTPVTGGQPVMGIP